MFEQTLWKTNESHQRYYEDWHRWELQKKKHRSIRSTATQLNFMKSQKYNTVWVYLQPEPYEFNPLRILQGDILKQGNRITECMSEIMILCLENKGCQCEPEVKLECFFFWWQKSSIHDVYFYSFCLLIGFLFD